MQTVIRNSNGGQVLAGPYPIALSYWTKAVEANTATPYVGFPQLVGALLRQLQVARGVSSIPRWAPEVLADLSGHKHCVHSLPPPIPGSLPASQ